MDIYGAKLMEFEKYLKTNNLVPENKILCYTFFIQVCFGKGNGGHEG